MTTTHCYYVTLAQRDTKIEKAPDGATDGVAWGTAKRIAIDHLKAQIDELAMTKRRIECTFISPVTGDIR